MAQMTESSIDLDWHALSEREIRQFDERRVHFICVYLRSSADAFGFKTTSKYSTTKRLL